jgi:hypothetical protein
MRRSSRPSHDHPEWLSLHDQEWLRFPDRYQPGPTYARIAQILTTRADPYDIARVFEGDENTLTVEIANVLLDHLETMLAYVWGEKVTGAGTRGRTGLVFLGFLDDPPLFFLRVVVTILT